MQWDWLSLLLLRLKWFMVIVDVPMFKLWLCGLCPSPHCV